MTVGGEADEIFGGLGADLLLGGAGNDVMHGDDDTATGGIGDDDTMWGGTGLDTMHGDGGDDTIFGESDPDKLHGDDGNDYLEGGADNDTARGGTGRDLLIAGYGSDDLDGEQDGDTYRITARGGLVTEKTIIYDSGDDGLGHGAAADSLILIGTPEADTVLLRGMADYYFPKLEKLIGDNADPGITDRFFNSKEPDKLQAILQALEDAYGPHAVEQELVEVDDVLGDLTLLQSKIIELYTMRYGQASWRPSWMVGDPTRYRIFSMSDTGSSLASWRRSTRPLPRPMATPTLLFRARCSTPSPRPGTTLMRVCRAP